MKKTNIYLTRTKNYYKLRVHKSSNKNSPGVLYYDPCRFSIREDEAHVFDKYKDRFVLKENRQTDPAYKWYLNCDSMDEAFKILKDVGYNIVMVAPKERITKMIHIYDDEIKVLQQIAKRVEEVDSSSKYSYRKDEYLMGEVFSYKSSTIEVVGSETVIVNDGEKQFTSIAAASRYIAGLDEVNAPNPWTAFKTSSGDTPDEICKKRSGYVEPDRDKVRNVPVSEHNLAWLKYLK